MLLSNFLFELQGRQITLSPHRFLKYVADKCVRKYFLACAVAFIVNPFGLF